MVLVAADLDELAILDLVDHGASVRAVMRTSAEESRTCGLIVHALNSPLDGLPAAALEGRSRGPAYEACGVLSISIPNRATENNPTPRRVQAPACVLQVELVGDRQPAVTGPHPYDKAERGK